MEPNKHNQARLLILKILAPEYPGCVDAFILRRCLANFGYPVNSQDLTSYLAYLRERGYVKLDEKKKFDITLVSITADGIDIVDGSTTDPGVGLEV